MFRDEIEIEVAAGRGGDGLVSFRRERSVPRGGPDGGDGGRGGSVVLVARDDVDSLLPLGRKRRYAASDGVPGGPRNRTGADARDLELWVPVGTQVLDAERGNLLRDLKEPGARLEVVLGGAGGRGNASFATAVDQAPRRATRGRDGERRRVRLELRMLADVGLVGLPNAGKSTFLAAVSQARPKIADYPFTTLEPQVGIASVGEWRTLCVADLPGLIEGAARGQGLGDRFLRHVERCAVLLHLVDVSDRADLPPERALEVVEHELAESSPALAAKPRRLVASKCEGPEAEARAARLEAAAGRPVHRLSSATGRGVRELLADAWAAVQGERTTSPPGPAPLP